MDFSNRLGACEVCGKCDAKYSCPKCEVKTCCLNCVNIHKTELACDGIRDRTKFIPVNKFTNLDLLSDIRLLQECSRNLDGWKKNELIRHTSDGRNQSHILHKLQNAAKNRKTHLKFLGRNFTRRKDNTTFLDWKANIIHWRIEWIFPNAGNLKFVDEKCDENLKLSMLIKKYLDISSEHFYKKESLVFYQSSGLSGCHILLKAEKLKNCSKKFYQLEPQLTLKENLINKTVIEFPSLFVVFRQDADSYTVIDSDEEIEWDDANVSRSKSEQLNKQSKEKKENKNLLFITEHDYSDLSLSSESESDNSVNKKIKLKIEI